NVFEVLSTNGDTHLGGDDYDEVLINYVAEEFRKREGIDLRKDAMALQRLKEACEKAKCELSSLQETTINLPYITADQSGPKHLQETLTRAKFEHLTRDLTERCRGPVMKAIKDAKLSPKDIDEVVLVGGSTRMPAVQQLAKEIFGKEPNKSINPDEVVAVGAAIQGAVLTGEKDDIVLLDVTPLSLGVETLGGVMTKLIERNTTIPTSRKEVFSTAADNQTEVTIHVLQGERELASGNRSLGRFNLAGIPPAPRGMPQIEVTFDIDANGILNVSAKDTATSKAQSIRIEGSSGLNKEEVERMRKEAELHAAEDKARRELVDLKNQADNLVYQTEKTLKEYGDRVPANERGSIEAALNQLKEAAKGDDKDSIRKSMEQLATASQTIGKIMYEEAAKKAGAAGAAQPDATAGSTATGSAPKDDDVIDAEFEEKK
ncbi:MAG TPA: molecular chaperone DnaK, partial [Phycisphaerae bacterium]|nr:molecular chaperone DnaK [Phycisphaerae bacterium]